jgi:hypothetical protein
MVLMARSVGIPARYATGYLPDAKRATGEHYVVVQADAHAWAELYFKDHGWVIFDATEGAAQVENNERGQTTDGTAWYRSELFRRLLDGAILFAVLAIAVVFLRSLKAPKEQNATRKRLDRLYLRFAGILQRRSQKRRDPSQTPREFLEMVRPSLNGSHSRAKEISDRFERAFYAVNEPSEEEVAKLAEDLREFETMLKKEPVPRP